MDPIRITATSGRIEVTAEARGDVVVDRGQEHPMGGVLEVQGAHSGVRMRVPIGDRSHHRVALRFGEAARRARQRPDHDAQRVARDRVVSRRSTRGRCPAGSTSAPSSGDAHIKAANGRITIGEVGGALTATSVSGTVEVGRAGGAVHATTVSGKVDVGMTSAADVRAESVSGTGAGRVARRRATERVDEVGERQVRVRARRRATTAASLCRSISGRITVR